MEMLEMWTPEDLQSWLLVL